uniref:Uncharacterized protein n=1 Tax=Desulfobacca acetoxidans TaxID=60893 RepID=A0A7V4LDC6_9BACT
MLQRMIHAASVTRRGKVLLGLAGLTVLFMVSLIAAPTLVQAASKIDGISLNEKVFTPDSPEIKGVAEISGMTKGQKVTADLIYGPENFKALSITKEVPGSGNISFSFSFSKPTKGWPQGDYKVVVTTSDGASMALPLEVK